MKKGGALLKGISFLLLLALLTYAGARLYREWKQPYATAGVEEAVLEEARYCRVYLARQEEALTLTGRYGFTAEEGEKVARGGLLAQLYDSEAAQARALRRQELNTRREALTALLAAATPKAAVYGELRGLHRALRQGDGEGLAAATLGLEALFLTGDDPAESRDRIRQELEEIDRELEQLEQRSDRDTQDVTALEAGLFSRVSDGFEKISPAQLEGISPTRLIALYAAGDAPAQARLVTGLSWTCAAILPADAAAALEPGQELQARFDSVSGSFPLRVLSTDGPVENGEQVVLLGSDRNLRQLLYLRRDLCRLSLKRIACLTVPEEALRRDPETGEALVYLISGNEVRAVAVELLATREGKAYLSAENTPLTAGAQVIVKAEGLGDGAALPAP